MSTALNYVSDVVDLCATLQELGFSCLICSPDDCRRTEIFLPDLFDSMEVVRIEPGGVLVSCIPPV
jgi:hypothetical protein